MMNKYILALCFMLCSGLTIVAQSFGVRAGLNFNKFNGPTEEFESLGLANGFHFGVNYSYHVTDLFSVMFEVGYTQYGTKQLYSGDSYYTIRYGNETYYSNGVRDMDLSVSNGYLMFPVVATYKASKKFEVFGGAYANILVNPTARGSFRYDAYEAETIEDVNEVNFVQSLDYNYRSDNALQGKQFGTQREIGVWIDGEAVYFPKNVGAYYQYPEKLGNLMNTIDAGLIGGFNYFINRGFYAGFRLEYGLTDITNERADISYRTLDENKQLIFRDDKDTNLGFNVSIGFRF